MGRVGIVYIRCLNMGLRSKQQHLDCFLNQTLHRQNPNEDCQNFQQKGAHCQLSSGNYAIKIIILDRM